MEPMPVILAILTFCSLLLIPGEAWAWGMGVHVQLGSQVLANLDQLPEATRLLLGAYPFDFLYGCISADIIVGKRFTHYLKHCHSWQVGEQVLAAAGNDAQRACATGYLAHLAADTIAHSYLIPFKLVRTFNTVIHGHAYWEMRFEARVKAESWDLIRILCRKDFRQHDQLLQSTLARTLFSFRTNKRVFNSLLLLSRLEQWQKMLRSLGVHSRWAMDETDQDEYLELAAQAVGSVLSQGEASPFRRADPAGERALLAARAIRNNLNLLWLDGKLPADEAERLLQEVKDRFRQSITAPEQLLELLSGY
jgi:hypothetical protein